jgi:hypothetical protein
VTVMLLEVNVFAVKQKKPKNVLTVTVMLLEVNVFAVKQKKVAKSVLNVAEQLTKWVCVKQDV